MATRNDIQQEGGGKGNLLQRMKKSIESGDKVTWVVLILLMMISVVAIFSSTSTMAMREHTTRFAIFVNHIKLVVAGLAVVLAVNAIPSIKVFRFFSQMGFAISVILLTILVFKINFGPVTVKETNGACRAITIGHFNLAVYEVVKVAMVMYLAWAVQAYGSASFKIANALAIRKPEAFGWLAEPRAQRIVYIFLPIMLVTLMILKGSTGSAVMTMLVMFVTIVIGGIKWNHVLKAAGVAALGALLVISIHILSSGKKIDRLQTAFNRMNIELPYPDAKAREAQRLKIAQKNVDIDLLKEGTPEFDKFKNAVQQPKSAEIALVEGGRRPFGKGPGRSTQKYVVPVMFEDYMYSFLIEEYGLLFGIFVLGLYMSLFARGVMLVHHSKNRFAQAATGGLVFLITFQALFHILVNCNIGLVTGQTLPLISHGRCSFLCFCIAFGVILSISVKVYDKMKKEQLEAIREAELAKLNKEVTDNESDN